MSGLDGALRKGDWLELRLNAADAAEASAPGQAAAVAGRLLEAPQLARRLQASGGLQLSGDRLRLRLFPAEPAGFEPEWMDLTVLYEDDYAMVVHKPAGVKVHPTTGETGTLAHGVAAYYEATGQQLAVRHVHRLDEWTSGPVLYAKGAYALQRLDEAMRLKAIGRIYLALAQGELSPPSGRIDAPIGRDRHHKQRRRVSPTGDPAVTHYDTVAASGGASLVRLRLETGRTHQIRVHLSHLGHPLLGDMLYGGARRDIISRQALHGERLVFPHPLSGEQIELAAAPPEDFRKACAKLGLQLDR
ncbi:RluA family pseudouridine synthase [Paenibacillus gansuensis]|uniref:Pseudouridine synthase n=1 Tax=Paenibacillus gansuensis TaxID=306542 RepID=A0ABW5PCF6_9BACL